LYVGQKFFALRSGRPRAHSPLPWQPFTHRPACARPFTSRQRPAGPPRTEGGLHTPRAEGTGSFSRGGERRESLLGRRDLGRCPRSVRLEFRPQAFARTAPAALPKPPDRDKINILWQDLRWMGGARELANARVECNDRLMAFSAPLGTSDALYMSYPPVECTSRPSVSRRDPCDIPLESPRAAYLRQPFWFRFGETPVGGAP
jgi:hypothetical protein